jgi:hypothetical protein
MITLHLVSSRVYYRGIFIFACLHMLHTTLCWSFSPPTGLFWSSLRTFNIIARRLREDHFSEDHVLAWWRSSSHSIFAEPQLDFTAALSSRLHARTPTSQEEDTSLFDSSHDELRLCKKANISSRIWSSSANSQLVSEIVSANAKTTLDLFLRAEDMRGGVSCEIFTPTRRLVHICAWSWPIKLRIWPWIENFRCSLAFW